MIEDDAVVAAARAAIERYGWRDATLERIADEAGLSRVTLYRRGVTKSALLETLAAQAATAYREALWPALTSADPADARIEAALTALCNLVDRNAALIRALDSAANAAVFHDPGAEALTRTTFTEPLERILRDGANEGTLTTGDAAELATTLFNLVAWTFLHLRNEHGWRAERARRATLEIALEGVRARSS